MGSAEPPVGRSGAHLVAKAVLLAACGPLLVGLVLAIRGTGLDAFFIAAISATLGPIVGLTSTAPYFTASFKLLLAGALLLSALAVFLGARNFGKWWGKLLLPLGGAAWTVCGAIGFGPQ